MAKGKFVSYLRVSTDQQGRSGLGLEAQRQAVTHYLDGGSWELLDEYVEVEGGKHLDRPQLKKAMHHALVTGATLIIAKLDRLSRDAHFLLGLQKEGVKFVCADMPEANETMVGFMAVMAEHEGRMISRRTKEALAVAKARGVKLGNPNGARCLQGLGNDAAVVKVKANAAERAERLRPIIEDIQAGGDISLRGIAKELNRRGILTARGGRWFASTVRQLLGRLAH